MRSVGIKVLKNKLSEYVRLAAGGETILVTDRDQIVAELGPPRPERSPMIADTYLADAIRRGLVNAPTMPGSGPPPSLPVAPFEQIMDELDRDREDR